MTPYSHAHTFIHLNNVTAILLLTQQQQQQPQPQIGLLQLLFVVDVVNKRIIGC